MPERLRCTRKTTAHLRKGSNAAGFAAVLMSAEDAIASADMREDKRRGAQERGGRDRLCIRWFERMGDSREWETRMTPS